MDRDDDVLDLLVAGPSLQKSLLFLQSIGEFLRIFPYCIDHLDAAGVSAPSFVKSIN